MKKLWCFLFGHRPQKTHIDFMELTPWSVFQCSRCGALLSGFEGEGGAR